MLDLVLDVGGYLLAALGGGWLKTLYDRRNTVLDRRVDRQQEVVDELLTQMPNVRNVHREYRSRREGGVTETPEERTALDLPRSNLQAQIVRLRGSELRTVVQDWLDATERYAGQDPEMPAWKENEVWETAIEDLGSAVRD